MKTSSRDEMMAQLPDWLFQTEEHLDTGQTARIEYDREGDILEVFFAEGSGRGIELADEIVLRYDPRTGMPLSLIFLTYSQLVKPTPYGPESFRLHGMEHVPATERERIMQILTSPPVNRYLRVSAVSLTPDANQFVPITYVRQQLAVPG